MADRLRVLSFAPKLRGHEAPDLSAHFYDEFIQLSRFVDLTVMVEGVECTVTEAPFRVVRVPSARTPKLRGLLRCTCYPLTTALLREVDLVYLRSFSPHELLATLASHKPIVLRVIGTWIFEPATSPRNRVFLKLYRMVAERASIIAPYSVHQLRDLLRYCPGLDLRKVRVVPNAIDPSRFKPSTEARRRVRSKLKIPEDHVVASFVGVLSERKGVHVLLKAWGKLPDNLKCKAHLLLIGPISMKLPQLPRNVKIIGPVPNSIVSDYLSASDIFVLPSVGGEGLSRAALEAAAIGLPLLVTSVGGMYELTEAALVIPPCDEDALANALSALIDDYSLRVELGLKSRKLLTERFTWDNVIPKLVSLFREAVRGKPAES